jgi:hypothetical protein
MTTLTEPKDYLEIMSAGADIALTAPQPTKLYLSLASRAAQSNRRLTIHRAELVDAEVLKEVATAAPGHVTFQFSHGDASPHVQ